MFTQSLFRSVSLKCQPTPALLISNVWKWTSGLRSTSGCLISYSHSQTIKSKNSKGSASVLFFFLIRSCTLYGVILTEISTQAWPSLPSLWIFHLRWCLIWLFLSSRISSPWRSQVVISRAGPHPPSPPPPKPSDVWSRARGGRPDIQPRLWRPSLSVPCTLAPCCEAWRKSRSQENNKSTHLLSRG